MPTASEGADDAVERLYAEHWTSLVRLGALLLRDPAAAEEVVQDAFIALHRRWGSVREQDKALAYLRRSVVNGCRSAQRKQAVAGRHVPDPCPRRRQCRVRRTGRAAPRRGHGRPGRAAAATARGAGAPALARPVGGRHRGHVARLARLGEDPFLARPQCPAHDPGARLMTDHDRIETDLHEAVQSYGTSVTPTDRLGEIRRATRTRRRVAWQRPWVLVAGAAFVTATIVVGAMALLARRADVQLEPSASPARYERPAPRDGLRGPRGRRPPLAVPRASGHRRHRRRRL